MFNIEKIHENAAKVNRGTAVNFRLDDTVAAHLKAHCEAKKLSQSALLRELVAGYLSKVEALDE